MTSILTLQTMIPCVVHVHAASVGDALLVKCGTDVRVGSRIVYCYSSADGCSYHIYDAADNCISERVVEATSTSSTRGGSFAVEANMSHIVFSSNVSVSAALDMNVAELIRDVDNLNELYQRLEHCNVSAEYIQDIVHLYLDSKARPVGAVYLSSIEVDPVALFGGVWEPLKGIFHESIFAWTCIESSTLSIAVADEAVVDVAVCV